MHITQLEIDNFKSFARKTKIPFFEGFTVISGPNGSGKSNIIDAILFCLALSTSRGLRAEKLTDLINLNSGKNNAEVAITFSDGSTVRRRIKRTPAGYYSYNYLNERLCKQSDIIDLLAKIGIKPEGYNVVMQGDITRIMEMSDVERRKIIDDIAGVAEFDHKKEQSLAELEVVRERIEREELLLRELADQLKKLLHERDRALVYRKLQDQLSYFQRLLGAARLKEKQHELLTATQLMTEQQQAQEKIAGQIRAREEEIALLHKDQEALEAELNQKSGPEYMELLARLEAAKSGIKLAEQTITRARAEKEENKETLNAVFLDVKRAEAKVKELNDAVRSFGIDRANLAMDLAAGKATLEKLDAELTDRSKEVEGAKEHLFSQMEQAEGLKGKRADLLRQQDAILEKSRMRITELERLSARLQQVATEAGEKEKQSGECEEQRKKCLAEKSALERVIADAEASLFAQRASQERIRKEVKVREQELMRLEAQQQARDGGDNRALEAVLAMEGVHGTIAQLGKAPKEYASALDVAVGGKLNFVVVDDDSVASSAIGYLKENKLGRATFLPLNKLRPVDLPVLKGDGIVDYAVHLVEFDPAFESAFRTVLGATVIVETLEKARRMMGRHRMVTLEGELLEKSGAMTGGSLQKRGRGFGVAAGDETAKLRLALAGLAQEAADCDEAIATLAKKVEDTRGKRSSFEEQIARFSILLEEYAKRIQAIAPEKEELEQTIAGMRTDASGSSGELAAIEASVAGVNKEI
ncbi:MAG: AAA family ATPase, partial [Methanomicrobiales archaeon]|nr:AAA family ATPase [Methanomicrobiales archaeon]